MNYSQIFLQPAVTLIAAGIAAVVSLISLVVNVRTQKHLAVHSSTISEQKETRDALRSLTKRLAEIRISVTTLVDLASCKHGDDLIIDAMQTLSRIAVFFTDTAPEQLIGFPEKVVKQAKEIRRALTKFFVFIDYDEVRNREHMDTLREQQSLISDLVGGLIDEIARYVAAPLSPLDGAS